MKKLFVFLSLLTLSLCVILWAGALSGVITVKFLENVPGFEVKKAGDGHDHTHAHEGHNHGADEAHDEHEEDAEHAHNHEGESEDAHNHEHEVEDETAHNHAGEDEDAHEAISDEHEGHNHAEGEAVEIKLTAEQAQIIDVQIDSVREEPIREELVLRGEVRLNADSTLRIMPVIPGFVKEIYVSEGDYVKAKQPLAFIMSLRLSEYYSSYNSAQEQVRLATREFEMAEQLFKKAAISEKDFIRYRMTLADAQIARQQAMALLRSLDLDPEHLAHVHHIGIDSQAICTEYEIISNIEGTVIRKNINVGQNFSEDNFDMVFEVSNLKELWVDLQASAAEMRKIKVGMDVEVKLASEEKTIPGKVIYIPALIDETSRKGLIRVLIQNPEGTIRPGEFVEGRIEILTSQKMNAVNRDAVQLIAGEQVIFVPKHDGYIPQKVDVTKVIGARAYITSGLHAGDAYVRKGGFELKSILLTTGMDPHAGHGH